MYKASKKQTTQVSTTRRKLLKKLSYSPPLLMCLGTLTKPSVTEAGHGGGNIAIYWLSSIAEGIAFQANGGGGFFGPFTEDNPDFIAWRENHFSAETIAAARSGPLMIP